MSGWLSNRRIKERCRRFLLKKQLKLYILHPVRMLLSVSSSPTFPSNSLCSTIQYTRQASFTAITTIRNRVRKRGIRIKIRKLRTLTSMISTVKTLTEVIAFHLKTIHITIKSLIEQMKSLDSNKIRRLVCHT